MPCKIIQIKRLASALMAFSIKCLANAKSIGITISCKLSETQNTEDINGAYEYKIGEIVDYEIGAIQANHG